MSGCDACTSLQLLTMRSQPHTHAHIQTSQQTIPWVAGAATSPGSLTRLKNDPSAVNMSVLLKEVTRPMAESMPNQVLCSRKEEAPVSTAQHTTHKWHRV